MAITSYIITFAGGGAMGALINRHFTIRDRKKTEEEAHQPDYLKLITIKESVKSHSSIEFNGTQCKNLIFKELTLENNTTKDIEFLEIIFEFDKDSDIVKEMCRSKKGLNAIPKRKQKSSEIVYELKHFNRTNKITFEFHVANFSRNFFSAIIDKCTGIELDFSPIDIVEQPSIPPGTIISKEQFL